MRAPNIYHNVEVAKREGTIYVRWQLRLVNNITVPVIIASESCWMSYTLDMLTALTDSS